MSLHVSRFAGQPAPPVPPLVAAPVPAPPEPPVLDDPLPPPHEAFASIATATGQNRRNEARDRASMGHLRTAGAR